MPRGTSRWLATRRVCIVYHVGRRVTSGRSQDDRIAGDLSLIQLCTWPHFRMSNGRASILLSLLTSLSSSCETGVGSSLPPSHRHEPPSFLRRMVNGNDFGETVPHWARFSLRDEDPQMQFTDLLLRSYLLPESPTFFLPPPTFPSLIALLLFFFCLLSSPSATMWWLMFLWNCLWNIIARHLCVFLNIFVYIFKHVLIFAEQRGSCFRWISYLNYMRYFVFLVIINQAMRRWKKNKHINWSIGFMTFYSIHMSKILNRNKVIFTEKRSSKKTPIACFHGNYSTLVLRVHPLKFIYMV